jgi:hypothetical protein
VADCRPGYGYAGIKDRFFDDMAPAGSGVTHVNLETGAEKLIVSHELLSKTGEVMENHPTSKHHAYHLLVGPDGKRFIMLHRWTQPKGGHLTRLITANMDGSDLRIVIPNGYASHFIWRDATHILSQAKDWLGNKEWGDFLFEDKDSGIVAEIGHGVLDGSGHLTYLKNNEWILNDTYPKGRAPHPDAAPLPHRHEQAHRPRLLPAAAGIQRRVARGLPPAQQPRRALGVHRRARRRERPPASPDRHPGPARSRCAGRFRQVSCAGD